MELTTLRQRWGTQPTCDLEGALNQALARWDATDLDGKTVAIGVGSRGIHNYAAIIRGVGERFRSRGAAPFLVPAMGSHGGADARGQRSVLESAGITEASMGLPILDAMASRSLGRLPSGVELWFAESALEADWIFPVNRVKPHTDFSGEWGSGSLKMLTVGFGKREGAADYHQCAIRLGYERALLEKGQGLLERLPVLGGLGIIENARHETAEIVSFSPEGWMRDEPQAQRRARDLAPSIPFEGIDLLIVDQMGKNISGTGMDTNVIGRGVHGYSTLLGRESMAPPFVKRLYVRSLTPETHGNAIGVGLADFTHRRLAEAIDLEPMKINTLTSLTPHQAKIPMVFDSDTAAVEAALRSAGHPSVEEARVVQIRDTLNLETLRVSSALLAEVADAPHLERGGDYTLLPWD